MTGVANVILLAKRDIVIAVAARIVLYSDTLETYLSISIYCLKDFRMQHQVSKY
jgi:hypothetical protein